MGFFLFPLLLLCGSSLLSLTVLYFSNHHLLVHTSTISAAEFHLSDPFSCEILLAPSFLSLTLIPFHLRPSLSLFPFSSCSAALVKSNLYEKTNKQTPFCLCFLAGCLSFAGRWPSCRKTSMASLLLSTCAPAAMATAAP